jgi:cytochrome c-type biogenesis protein CcmH/NrfG
VSEPAGSRLATAIARHRAAVEHYLRVAAEVREEAWNEPAAPGKWSADEITTHLRLALEALAREASGGAGMRVAVSAPRAFLFRWTILPRILATGRFPRVRAPREIRPAGPRLSRDDSLALLRAAADDTERICAATGARRATHPYFGRIRLEAMLRLFARHTQHHERQILAGRV